MSEYQLHFDGFIKYYNDNICARCLSDETVDDDYCESCYDDDVCGLCNTDKKELIFIGDMCQ